VTIERGLVSRSGITIDLDDAWNVEPSAPGGAPMLAIARSSSDCGTVIHEYLMLGIIAFIVVHVVEVVRGCRSDPRRLACIALNALGLRHFGNSAGRHRRRIS
jgi:hypothetical protein